MKKRFALTHTKKTPERVLEGIKNDIRKYIQREKKKPFPENTDFWRIDCKFAKNDDELQDIKFEDIIKNINIASQENCESFMIELVAVAIKTTPKEFEILQLKEEE
ncbi:MAG: DUF6172 family protein [Arcobacteraceae bacterium]|nr:DUF6172 family protein [Arcobacteraceae bacterium]